MRLITKKTKLNVELVLHKNALIKRSSKPKTISVENFKLFSMQNSYKKRMRRYLVSLNSLANSLQNKTCRCRKTIL